MDEKERAIFEELSQTHKEIRDILKAPKSKFQSTLDLLSSGVGIGGLVFIVDQIIKWFRG